MKAYASVMVICGVLVLAWAFYSAQDIPMKARADFYEYAKSNPLNSPGFPEAFMQMQTQRRLLQNFYLGATGLILLLAGTRGLYRGAAMPKA